ncbi:MAG TPA: hypothetical protein VFN30_06765 [Chitinophagaceae bacterium]|nr:hypothetical protein [Chitinophagaceae bacterium]
MNNSTASETQREELDLLDLLKPVKIFFKKIGVFFSSYFKKIVRRKILFLCVIFAIALFGFSLRFYLNTYYRTEAIFISHSIPSKFCSAAISDLNKLTKSVEDIPLLASKLHVNDSTAAFIKSIFLQPINDTFFLERKGSEHSFFKIKLVVNNRYCIDTIQKGIVYFLENNYYSLKRKEVKIKNLLALKDNLQKKIISLDSLKNIVNRSIIPQTNGQGIILGQPINPVSVYDAEVLYYKEQLKINEDLATIDNIEILQPFLQFSRPNYPNFNLIFIYFLIAGLIISTILTPLFSRK